MTTGVHSVEERPEGQVTIVTGEADQGQIIVAMSHIGQALEYGEKPFHNGCSNRGFGITPDTLEDESKFLDLLDAAPDGSTFVIADADSCPAITGGAPNVEPRWFRLCKAKGHDVILTTVRGVEHKIRGPLSDTATTHLYVAGVQDLPGIFITSSSGAMKERIPITCSLLDEERTISWATLTNGLYESPNRRDGELIVSPAKSLVVPVDYSDAVNSTATGSPKHPENTILLTKTVRNYVHLQEKTTEIISLPWLESVNKQRDEDMAVGIIDWTCERWGIELKDIRMNPKTTYPDAWGQHGGETVNLEVRKVQPRWPSGAPLASIADIIRAGKATAPQGAPVVQCKQCGTWEDRTITNVHVLPPHDSTHEWVCTYPKWMIDPEWADNLTALPNLLIKPGDLRNAVTEAVKDKDTRARRFGKGNQNWLVLSIEGFPLDERLHEELAYIDWKSLDAVFLILTSQFGSAIYQNQIDDNRIIVIARCPKETDHACYHPGVQTSVRKAGQEFQNLREETVPRGVAYQVVHLDGTVLAQEVEELELPVSIEDVMKGMMAANKKLPFQPTQTAFGYRVPRTHEKTGLPDEP